MRKIFKIIECTSDCPLKQTPAYDSRWCNFYGEDLDHFSFNGRKKKKPNFCKVKRVIVEEWVDKDLMRFKRKKKSPTMADLSREELLNRCYEKIQICCKLYYNTCRGTEEAKRCTQWGNQLRILIQQQSIVSHKDYVNQKAKMNIYEMLTSYVSLPVYYVVAESMGEANEMFLAKYPDFRTSDIKKIKLIAEDVIYRTSRIGIELKNRATKYVDDISKRRW